MNRFLKDFFTKLILGIIVFGSVGLFIYLVKFGEVPPFLKIKEKLPVVPEEIPFQSGDLQNPPEGLLPEEEQATTSDQLPRGDTQLPLKSLPPLPLADALPVGVEAVLSPKAFIALNCDGRAGTGFYVKTEGVILTAKHLVQAMNEKGEVFGEPAKTCWVWSLDGFNKPPPEYAVFEAVVSEMPPAVEGLPFGDDFALLEISGLATTKEECMRVYPSVKEDDEICRRYFNELPEVFETVSLGTKLPKAGADVIDVGLPREFAHTKSLFQIAGKIKEIYRNVMIINGNTEGGFSGGAAVNGLNEVVGLIYASDRENITYAIPIPWILERLDNI